MERAEGPILNLPWVTVVAVCFNHSPYLRSTLDSIEAQSHSNVKLIIMDDASTDNSKSLIREWIDVTGTDCVFIAHECNAGLCKTLNEALKIVESEYVQFIACDDIMDKRKLEKQISILQDNPDSALCCSNYCTIDKDGEMLQTAYFPQDYAFPADPFAAILKGHQGLPVVIHSPTVLLRKSVLDQIGGYPEWLLQEDFFIWLHVTHLFPVSFINECLVAYRSLDNSLSVVLTKTEKRSRYLKDHLKVIDGLLDLGDEKHTRVLVEAKLDRMGKLAIVEIGKLENLVSLNAYIDQYMTKLLLIFKEVQIPQRIQDAAVSTVLLAAWKKGRRLHSGEEKYLSQLKPSHRLPMKLKLPYMRFSLR